MFIPLIGIGLFLVSYFLAASYYPGGSDADRLGTGFDWVTNYWCDLLAKTAKNGSQNPGRVFSLTGTIILFTSLAIFWYHLPAFFHERKRNILLIRYTGSLSMFILIFIFTQFHDSVIGIGSTISAVPMAATLSELKKNRLNKLYVFGWICILLILLNFIIYTTNWLISWLPLIQKITLVLFLSWILLIDLKCLAISRGENWFRNMETKKS